MRAFVAGFLLAASAGAAQATTYDFSVTKDLTNGAFTFTDANPTAEVTELLVVGLGATAGTTLAGWQAAAILFSPDPLGCLADSGSTITSGFCYKKTGGQSAATVVGPTSVAFTYDASFDTTDPSEFFVGFQLKGVAYGCFGQTGAGGGCDAPGSMGSGVPEPMSVTLLGAGLLGLYGRRRLRGKAAV